MSIIRSREPYFKFLIRREVCGWFGIPMTEDDIKNSQNYVNDSLATFLTSSLNVELVHVILESITKYTKGMIDPTIDCVRFDKAKLKEKNTFSIDTIMIKNPDKWKVAKLPEFIDAA